MYILKGRYMFRNVVVDFQDNDVSPSLKKDGDIGYNIDGKFLYDGIKIYITKSNRNWYINVYVTTYRNCAGTRYINRSGDVVDDGSRFRVCCLTFKISLEYELVKNMLLDKIGIDVDNSTISYNDVSYPIIDVVFPIRIMDYRYFINKLIEYNRIEFTST